MALPCKWQIVYLFLFQRVEEEVVHRRKGFRKTTSKIQKEEKKIIINSLFTGHGANSLVITD